MVAKMNFTHTANIYSEDLLYIFYCCLVTKSFPAVLLPVDCSLPGYSVHGIFQAGILE